MMVEIPNPSDAKLDEIIRRQEATEKVLMHLLALSGQKMVWKISDMAEATGYSYEAAYEIGVPITHTSVGHAGWCYPALVQSSAGKQTYWILLTETAVRGNYCGTHLAEGDSIGNLRIEHR